MSEIKNKPRRGLIGAVIAAIVASLCCVGPLVLLFLGIGGAWVSRLTLLEPLRPYLMVVTFLLLAYAFYRIYFKPAGEDCEPGSYCANPRSDRINKISLWVVTVLVIFLFSVPYIANQASRTPTVEQKVDFSRVTTIVLEVPGMTCPSCPLTVQKSLQQLDGVLRADVSFEQKRALVQFDSSRVTVEQLLKATKQAGYPAFVK